MKTKALSIRIPNPCAQNWEAMEVKNDGRFCQSCQKTVVDFSAYSNAEIVKILANSTSGLCGRLTQRQLNQLDYYLIITPRNSSWRKYLGVLALGASVFMQGCEQPQLTKGKIIVTNKNANLGKPEVVSKIYGYVINEYNEPMVRYKVAIANTNLVAFTDENGKYEISSPPSFDESKKQLIYEDSNLKEGICINYNKAQQDTIRLTNEFMVMGDIEIVLPKTKN